MLWVNHPDSLTLLGPPVAPSPIVTLSDIQHPNLDLFFTRWLAESRNAVQSRARELRLAPTPEGNFTKSILAR